MFYKNIPSHELNFASNLVDSGGTKYSLEKYVVGDMVIDKIYPSFDSYYYKEKSKKTSIVLHHTTGYLKGDIDTICNENVHMSVSYVIARNGTVFELFDPLYWSYHLGKGAIGGNKTNSQRSIGIELSNIGYLDKDGDNLNTLYGDKYCSINDLDAYTVIDAWRGKTHYATFTDIQYESLAKLIKDLSSRFDIPINFINETDRYSPFKSSSDATTFNGICSHANYMSGGKWDLGPAFDFNRVMDLTIEKQEPIIDVIQVDVFDDEIGIIFDEPIHDSPFQPIVEVELTKTEIQPKSTLLSIFSFILKLFK